MRLQSLHNSSQADRARVLCSIVRDSQKHYNTYRACRTMKLSQREWHSEAFRKFQEYPESFWPLLEKGVFGVSIQSIVLLCAGEVFIPNSHVRHRWALLLGPWASAGTWDWDVACSWCSAWSREPPQKLRQQETCETCKGRTLVFGICWCLSCEPFVNLWTLSFRDCLYTCNFDGAATMPGDAFLPCNYLEFHSATTAPAIPICGYYVSRPRTFDSSSTQCPAPRISFSFC